MPFVPLTPEERKQYAPPCQSPEHSPPTHMVLFEVSKWVCPACGKETIVFPSFGWSVYWNSLANKIQYNVTV